MKYYDLDTEEKQILQDFNDDKFVAVKNSAQEKKRLATAAKYTLNKAKNINLRLTDKDLIKLKSIAMQQGLPYQTLASSILHRFVVADGDLSNYK